MFERPGSRSDQSSSRRKASERARRRRVHLGLESLEHRRLLATRIWDGGGDDALWTTVENWVDDTAPVEGDDLVFPLGADRLSNNNDFPAGTDFNTITVGEGSYFLGGNSIDLLSGVSGTLTSGTSVLAMDLVFLASPTFDVAAGGVIDLTGQVSESGGSFDLNKVGGGDLYFEQAASYSGATNINDGILTVNAGAILPASSPVTIGSTGTLKLVNGDGAIASLAGSGSVNLEANTLTVGDSSDTSYGGVISGTGGLTKVGTGALTLSGANTYSGATLVDAGILRVESEGALGTTAAGTTVSSGAMLVFSGGAMTFDEAFTIAGAGISNNGALRVESGEVTLDGAITMTADSRLATADGQAMTINGVIDDGAGTRAMRYDGGGTGRITLTAANTYGGATYAYSGFLRLTNEDALGDPAAAATVGAEGATLELVGGLTIPATKSYNFFGSGPEGAAKVISITGENALLGNINQITGQEYEVVSGSLELAGIISGANNLTKIGDGTLTLSGSSTYTGTTTVDAGTLLVAGDISASSGVQVNTGGTLGGNGTVGAITSTGGTVSPGLSPGILSSGSVAFDAGTTFEVELNGLSVGTDYDQLAVSGDVNLGGATLDVTLNFAPSIGEEFVIIDNDDSIDLVTGTFAGLPEGGTFDDGAYQFTISYVGGDGNDVVLTVTGITYTWDGGGGDNNWSTAANWVGDIVPVEGASLVFPDGAARLNNNNNFAANTDFNTITFGGAGYLLSGNPIDLLGGVTGTFTSGTSQFFMDLVLLDDITVEVATGGVVDFYGAVGESGGPFGLTKTGEGGLYFNQAASYSGATNINDGGIGIEGGAILPATSAVTIGATGILAIYGDGTIASLAGSGSVNLGANTLTVGDATDTTYNGVISGTGGLTKVGTGTLTLSGANTYDGATNVFAGALRVENDAALGTTTGGTIVSDGASVFFNGADLTVAEAFNIQGTGLGGGGVLAVDSGSATLTGAINMLGDSQIGAAEMSTLTIQGIIDDTDISPARNLTITNGAFGGTVLEAQQRYDGSLTVTSGFLRAASYGAFLDPATANTVTIQSGATLELSGGFTQPAIHSIVIDGLPLAGFSKVVNVSGDNALMGNISITGINNTSFGVDGGDTLTLGGAISGSVDFDKNGAGTLVLTGTSTHTGNVNVGDGTLIVDGSLATSNLVFVDGTLRGNGVLPNVAISGIGTLAPGNSPGILSSGSVTLVDGSTFAVELDGTTAGSGYDQLDVTGSVNLGGATLDVSLGFAPALNDEFIIINNDGDGDPIAGTFAGLAEGATFTSGPYEFTITYAGGTDNNDVVLTVTGITLTWDGGGADEFWTTAANWVGDVAPVAGANLIFAEGAARLASFNDFAANTGFGSITIAGAGYDISGNAIDLNGGISATYSGGSSTFGLDLVLTADTTIVTIDGATLVASGNISGSQALTKGGAGTLDLGGTNSYTGATTVNAGTLALGGGSAIADAGAVTVNAGGTLMLDADETIGSLAGSGSVVDLGTSTLTAGGNDANTSYSGVIVGDGDFVKQGAGTFSLSGNNSYTGTTSVNAGALAISNANALGTTAGGTSIAADARLEVSGGITVNETITSLNGTGDFSGALASTSDGNTWAGNIVLGSDARIHAMSGTFTISGEITESGASTLTKSSAGTMVLSGTNSFSVLNIDQGIVALSGGSALADTTSVIVTSLDTLRLDSDETIGSLASSFANSAVDLNTFTLTTGGNDSDTSFAGDISGAGSLIKAGTGTMTLSGYHSYTGATVVSGGTLVVNGSIADSSSLTMADGTTLGGLGMVPDLIVQAGATVAPGNSPGTLTVDGDLAFAGGSTFAVDIDGTVAIDDYDQMIAQGEVNLGGATLLVTLGDGFEPGAGDQFLILDNQGGSPIVGTFAGLGEGAVLEIDGASFRISYVGGDGDDVELTSVVVTTTTVTSSANPSAFGDDVTFTITVTASVGTPTGFVSLLIDGTTYSGVPLDGYGMASLQISGLNPGIYPVLVAYDGNSDFLPSDGSLEGGQVVGEAPSVTSVIASANPSAFGQGVTFTATVSGALLGMPTPTGTVEFFSGAVSIGSAPLVDGVASLAVSDLAVGGHSITANYLGDDFYLSSTSPVLVQGVNPAVVGVSVVPSGTSAVTGESLTFDLSTATIAPGAGIPQGTVRMSINGVPEDDILLDSDGEGSITVQFDSTGIYLLSFQFLDNTSFVGEGVITIGVDVAADSTTTTLVSSTDLAVVGQPVVLTATVAPVTPGGGTPDGEVSFFQVGQLLGSAPLVDGVATLSVSDLPYGLVNVEAVYDGSGNYDGSASESVSIAVTVVMGDYDGDGKADLSLYEYFPALNSGQFTILLSSGGTMSGLLGGQGAIPVVGDFDGDGRSDMAVFDPYTDGATWLILDSSTGELRSVQFGASGLMDLPAPADYDGDGVTDIATFRPDSDLVPGAAQWFILPSDGASAYSVLFGAANGMDMPVPADYDGDGKADIATFRADSDLVPGAAQWFILPSDGASAYSVLFGAGGGVDQPVPADYDGDGKADIATFRTSGDGSSAEWFILPSDGSSARMISLGQVGSVAAPGGYGGPAQADLGTFDRVLAQWRLRAFSDPTVDMETFGQRSPRVVPVLASLSDRLDAVNDDDGDAEDDGPSASSIDAFLASIDESDFN